MIIFINLFLKIKIAAYKDSGKFYIYSSYTSNCRRNRINDFS